MNVYAGWPGSVHDARILANSALVVMGEAETLVPNTIRTMNRVPVPVVILGDPACPLLPWLMKPYPGVGLSAKQRKFNTHLSRARVVVECAFGMLKGRWRCLLKRNDVNVEFMSTLVTACCVLHNICEVHHDTFDQQWFDEEVRQASNMTRNASTIPSSSTAASIRNVLCDYIDRTKLHCIIVGSLYSSLLLYLLIVLIDAEQIHIQWDPCKNGLILLWTIEHTMKHLSINATFHPSRASSGIQNFVRQTVVYA